MSTFGEGSRRIDVHGGDSSLRGSVAFQRLEDGGPGSLEIGKSSDRRCGGHRRETEAQPQWRTVSRERGGGRCLSRRGSSQKVESF